MTWATVESSWNVMAHSDAQEGKWMGNWRMQWEARTLTRPRNVVYPALIPLTRTPRLPVVDWTDAPADLSGLVRFAERQNLVSARVPSHFKRSLRSSAVSYGTCPDLSAEKTKEVSSIVTLYTELIKWKLPNKDNSTENYFRLTQFYKNWFIFFYY
jgi:hypothetical protein